MQTVAPSKKYILAKPSKKETQTKSGFLLSDKSVEAPKLADVISVGGDVKEYAEGDTIIYKPYTTTDINLNDELHFLIEEIDVLGRVTNV